MLREQNVRLDDLMPLIREQLAAGKTVRFAPRGQSMRPMLREGIDQVVLAAPPQKLRKYDLPLYRRESGQYVLHRIVRVDETAAAGQPVYSCIGDNQFALEHNVHHDQIIAVVCSFYRGRRQISVRSPLYRLYCRLWHYSRWPRRMVCGTMRRFCRLIGSNKKG